MLHSMTIKSNCVLVQGIYVLLQNKKSIQVVQDELNRLIFFPMPVIQLNMI